MLVPSGAPPAAQTASAPLQIDQLIVAARQDSNDPVVFHQLALAYLRSGRPDLASQALRTAITIDPAYAPAFLALMRLPPVHAPPPVALTGVAQTVTTSEIVYPGSLLWNAPSAYWYLTMGLDAPNGVRAVPVRLRDGSRMYQMPPAIWDDERLIQRAFFLDPLQELVVPDLPLYWHRTIGSAIRAFHDQRYADAYVRCDTVLVRGGHGGAGPTPAVALWYHALAAVKLARWEAAIGDLDRLEREFVPDDGAPPVPRSEALEYALGRVYELAGRLDEAEDAYARVILVDPLRAEPHAALARVLEGRRRSDAAVDEWQRAIERDRGDAGLRYELGRSLAAAGWVDESVTELQRAIAANPRETQAYYSLGLSLERLGRRDEAKEAYQRFLALAPRRLKVQLADAQTHLAALQ